MALAQEDIEKIQILIRESIAKIPEVGHANVRYELDLRERTIRVEEELKHQRMLMLTGFEKIDKRFEQIREEFNKRFEQVDKRFEQIREEFNKRFEQVDKRFEQVDKRFEQVDKRFEQIDKHFEQINKQFEQINKQFDKQNDAIMSIHQEIKQQMRWSFGILLGVAGLVIGALKLMSV